MSKKTETKEIVDEDGVVYAQMSPSPFYSPYFNRRPRAPITFDPAEKRTKDGFKDDCDVNKIWANFVRTGRLDQLQKAKGFYADLTGVPTSYQESLNLVLRTRDMFDQLPSDIRNIFGNDVQAFMEAAQNNPDGLFDVLKPLQPIDGSGATPVAPPMPEPIPDAPKPQEPPLTNPAS